MLRQVRQALAAQSRRRRCAVLLAAGFVLVFSVWSLLRVETEERTLQRLVDNLETEDSWLRRRRVALWQALPAAVQDLLPARLAPRSIGHLKRDAISDLVRIGPAAAPHLARALDDPLARQDALAAICSLGPAGRAATPRLLQGVEAALTGRGTNAWARSELPMVLQAIGAAAPREPAVVDALIACLSDRNGQFVSDPAARALVQLAARGEHGVPFLEKALQRPGPWRTTLVEGFALCRGDSKQILEALAHWLEAGDPAAQAAAARGLGRLGTAAAPVVPRMVVVLRDQRDKPLPERVVIPMSELMVRRYGLVPTAAPSPPRYVFAVDGTQAFSLRELLIRALGVIGSAAPETVPALVEEYQDVHSYLRFDAAVTRWRVDGAIQDVLPVFARGMADPDPKTRLVALNASAPLATSGPAVIPLFTSALSDPAVEVRLTAIRLCTPFAASKPEVLGALANRLSDAALEVRLAAIRVCAPEARSHPEIVLALAGLLADSASAVRWAAAEACAPFVASEPRVLAGMTNGVSDPAPDVRVTALRACARLAPTRPELVPLLTGALTDPEVKVRRAALEGCEPLVAARPELISALTNGLQDRQMSLRVQSARLVGRCGSNALCAVPSLTRLLGDANPLVRAEASNALEALRPYQRPLPASRREGR